MARSPGLPPRLLLWADFQRWQPVARPAPLFTGDGLLRVSRAFWCRSLSSRPVLDLHAVYVSCRRRIVGRSFNTNSSSAPASSANRERRGRFGVDVELIAPATEVLAFIDFVHLPDSLEHPCPEGLPSDREHA